MPLLHNLTFFTLHFVAAVPFPHFPYAVLQAFISLHFFAELTVT